MPARIRLKPEVKDLWTTRLRSGQDVQGTGRLHMDTGEKCCLGVLCAIAVEQGVIDPPLLVDDLANPHITNGGKVYKYDDEITGLPMSVQEWAYADREGQASSLGHYEIHTDRGPDQYPLIIGRYLYEDNDSSKKPFPMIADIIEEHF